MRLQSLGGGQWGFSEKEELLLQAGMGPSEQDKQVGCSRYAMCPHQIYGAPFTESQCCTRDYLKHFTRINSFHPQACLQNDLHPHTDTEWRTERLGTWGPLLFLLVFLLLNPGPLSSKSCIFPFSISLYSFTHTHINTHSKRKFQLFPYNKCKIKGQLSYCSSIFN